METYFEAACLAYGLDQGTLDERAAIMEFDGGLNREAAEIAALTWAIRQRDCRKFFDLLFEPEDIIEIRAFPTKDKPGRPFQAWTPATGFERYLDTLGELNSQGYGIYYGVLPRLREGGGKDADAGPGKTIWADFDGLAADGIPDLERRLLSRRPRPAALLRSGHGLHAYWRLDRAVKPAELCDAGLRVAVALGADPKVCNPSRVMRLPDFWNWKKPRALAALMFCDASNVTTLAAMHEAFPSIPERAKPAAKGRNRFSPPHLAAAVPAASENLRRARRYVGSIPSVPEGSRNLTGFKVAASLLVDFELPPGVAWGILADWNQGNQPPLDERELAAVFKSAARCGKHEPGRLNRPGAA
ncbi:MAG: primase alpha helix C-terminal domain-containing protein [Planctomycetota bacterium]|jgi:hypothetical protein|nr:primase alpha helix C-terminal domain-containing protein [Planctomycetota bacterium]